MKKTDPFESNLISNPSNGKSQLKMPAIKRTDTVKSNDLFKFIQEQTHPIRQRLPVCIHPTQKLATPAIPVPFKQLINS
jgi:hypothetical protein